MIIRYDRDFFMPQLHRTTIESTIEGKTKNVYISQLKTTQE